MIQSSASRIRRRLAAMLAIACAALPGAASAVSCTVSTTAVNFGVYNPLLKTPLSTTGGIDAACTCTVIDCIAFAYRIEVSAGQSGTTADRAMRSGNASLRYNLYSDAGYGAIWGTGSAGYSVLYLIALFGSKQTSTVYARMPAGQMVPPGSYADAPVVTIFY
jgi:spore coat protein U-like protein